MDTREYNFTFILEPEFPINSYILASESLRIANQYQMKKISFAKDITENELRKENFIHSFLSSIRQKMLSKRK